jgi:hypothetical protein
MQRSFEPMRKQVEAWQRSELTDVTAKVVIYEAFVEGELEAPKHLARTVHDLYFEPTYEEFRPRTIWSLSNAFASTGVDTPERAWRRSLAISRSRLQARNSSPPEGCSCKRELDGGDGFTFAEFGVGSDTEGFQQAGLHLPREGVDLFNAEACGANPIPELLLARGSFKNPQNGVRDFLSVAGRG